VNDTLKTPLEFEVVVATGPAGLSQVTVMVALGAKLDPWTVTLLPTIPEFGTSVIEAGIWNGASVTTTPDDTI